MRAYIYGFAILAIFSVAYASEECPAEDSLELVLLPNEEDCGSFWKCDSGVPLAVQCPPGLHFNNELQVCDYPANAKCAVECPAEDSLELVLLPNEKDCGSFWKCDSGVPLAVQCPDGLHFNNDLQVCDYPEKAGCDPEYDESTED